MGIHKHFSFKSAWMQVLGVFAVSFLCTQSVVAQTTETFNFTGAVQTWTVPPGVSSVMIKAWGAEGGNCDLNASVCPGQAMGGNGGYSEGNLAVSPGTVLNIYVGGAGGPGNTGGFNGGGQVNGPSSTCSKGGGASDVRVGGTALTDRKIVAGGGGGAEWAGGCGHASNGGGLTGLFVGCGDACGSGGGQGTQTAGGAAGANPCGGTPPTAGTLGVGGSTPTLHAGSGGGGYYGGGGGGCDGHGGGGSGYIGGVTGGMTMAGNTAGNLGNGRIEITYSGGGGGSGGQCNATTCVLVTCPADITVTCIEDFEPNVASVIATFSCGSENFRYVTQPHVTGAANCPGTTYVYTYKIGDSAGNVGCCDQTVTISNAAPTISVPAGTTVNCYEDIETSNDDATVNTSCGEAYDLKILPPVVNGIHECPGTTYTYAYRVRDNCGREVIANRIFTIGNNPAPTIVAPPDMTISCNYFAELNPAYAEVTTGCTLGYTTTVTGPTTTGTANCPGATYTYTYTVTDECGRTASDTRKFTIANTAPVFLTCPSVPLLINCEDDGWQQIVQAWLASVTAESSCGTALNVTNNYNPNTQGLCINNGTRIVRWMATDNCGRTSICEQMLIVADTEPPVFVTAPQNELVVCNYITQDKLDAWVDAHGNAVVDDCWSNITWTTTPNNPTINCGGNPGPTSVTVTFIATDGCGNKSSMDATFTALPAIGIGGSNEEDLTEESLQLFQNQPNPFNDQTTISFYLPEATKAILSIYDVSGKLLKEIKGDYSEGMNMEEISRSDLQGAGLLYYKLSTENETATRRMILLD